MAEKHTYLHEDLRISIAGGGNAGTALFRYFHSLRIPVDCIIDNNPSRITALEKEFGPERTGTSLLDIPTTTNTLFICTQDSAISAVAQQLAATIPQPGGLFVAHISGLRTSSELEALEHRGAITGSFHPIQSFHTPALPPEALRNIGCGLEGNAAFMEQAIPLARHLRWNPLAIRKENKPLYHAACVFAGNLIAALAEEARNVMRHTTDDEVTMAHLLPIMKTVLERLEHTPVAEALTGPASRGDRHAVSAHVRALQQTNRHSADVYVSLTKRILKIVPADSDMRASLFDALEQDQ